MANGELQDILRILRDLDERVNRIEKQHIKRGLRFEEAIPPREVCREVVDDPELGNWFYVMRVLSDYYGIDVMQNFHNPEKVPKNAIACYHVFEKAAYYKRPKSSLETVLHEYFHHLCALGVVVCKKREEEKLADRYAKIVIERGQRTLEEVA